MHIFIVVLHIAVHDLLVLEEESQSSGSSRLGIEIARHYPRPRRAWFVAMLLELLLDVAFPFELKLLLSRNSFACFPVSYTHLTLPTKA